MNTEPEGPLDLWKSAPPAGKSAPPATPAARSERQSLPMQPTPPPPLAAPRNLYPHPQRPTAPQYAPPVAGPQYPTQYPPQYAPPQPTAYPLMNVVQNNVGYGGPIVQRAFPHGLHLMLSLITCGLWLPIWLIHYLVAGNR